MQSAIRHIFLTDIAFGKKNVLHSCHLFQSTDSEYCLLLSSISGSMVLLNKNLLDFSRSNLGIVKDDDVYLKLKQRAIINYAGDTKYSSSEIFKDYFIRPNFFLIDITKRCNLNCKYCFRKLSCEVISDKVIDIACEKIKENCTLHRISSITIQPWGGEPLLIPEKIERIYNNFISSGIKVHFTLETNGTLLSDFLLHKLSRMNIHIGVSIDGCKYVHDVQRPFKSGAGSYDRIWHNIRLAKNNGYRKFSIISVLTKEGLPYLEESISTFLDSFGINQFKFNPVHKSSFRDSEFSLSYQDLEVFAARLFEYYVNSCDKGNIFNEDNITQRINNILQRDNSNICFSQGCHGGYRMLSIGLDGNIYPCELMDYPNESIGNVFEDRTLNQMIKTAVMDKQYFVNRLSGKCKMCPWIYFCRGGCTSVALHYAPNINGIDETSCKINQVMYPLIIKRILSDEKHKYRLLR